MRTIKLSPSDFAFLLNECPRCYYNKYVSQAPRPSTPMAKIFSTIDRGMQSFLMNKDLQDIVAGCPDIRLTTANGFCTSEAIIFNDLDIQVYVHGKFDLVGTNEDIGGYVVADGKTCFVKEEHVKLYAAQLHAYAFALSKSAEGATRMEPVNRLGLIVFEPDVFAEAPQGARLEGKLVWQEIKLDKKEFMRTLRRIAELLSGAEPPAAANDCAFCQYTRLMTDKQLIPEMISATV